VKAFRAIVHLKDVPLRVVLYEAPRGSVDRFNATAYHPKQVFREPAGYETFTHNLGCNTAHLVVMTKLRGFMPCVGEESLWRELTSPRYTTPVLRQWCPYLLQRFRERKMIVDAVSWGCQPGCLTATQEELDDVVRAGLAQGKIAIE
jgi:hypothetical protein